MKKLVMVTAIAAATFGAVSTAQAEVSVSANANLTSDYKFRGLSQTNAGPAFQGGFDVDFGNGFYAGNWNSNVNFTGPSGAGLEMDFYAGYAGEFNGVGYDVGTLYYYYEGFEVAPGDPKLDTLEIYGKLAYKNAYAKLSYALSDDYFGAKDINGNGDLGGSTYLDLGYSFPLSEKLSLTAHYGLTSFDKDVMSLNGDVLDNYSDYSLGATYSLAKNYSVTAAYIDTSKKAETFYGKDLAEGSLVLTLSAKF
jgi:uncharacterized protein (TIGR02001 family)